jgi:hypothetical protein
LGGGRDVFVSQHASATDSAATGYHSGDDRVHCGDHRWDRRVLVSKNFRREGMSEEEAYLEGQREEITLPVTDVRRQTWIPCVGGPHDGRLMRVPTRMLQTREGSGEKPEMTFPASPSGLQAHVPLEDRVFATYSLDRSSRILRYKKSHKLREGA